MGVITRYFTITAPKGMSTVNLDSRGCGTAQYSVKNVGASAKWPLIALVIGLVQAVGCVTTATPPPTPTPAPIPTATPAPIPTTTPAPTPKPYPLGGSWVNDNPNSNLTRLIITQDSGGVSVHAFGKCTSCDWGTQRGSTPRADLAQVAWAQGWMEGGNMTLELTSSGHLMSTVRVARGTSQVVVDSFHKQ